MESRFGHLFVRALVSGEELGLFLFDTGASFSGLSPQAADELLIEPFGQMSIGGLGGGLTPTQLRRADTVQLGPLIIDDLVFRETRRALIKEVEGESVVGVLGWDVMRRARVEIESRGRLWLYEPSSSRNVDLPSLPLHVHYEVPYVSVRFEGDREGLFMLDSGAGGMTVMFFHHASRELGFLDQEQGGPEVGHGAGGDFSHSGAHLKWFELGAQRFENLSIAISPHEDGESDPYSLGLIGGGLLERYRLVFEYANRRVALIER